MSGHGLHMTPPTAPVQPLIISEKPRRVKLLTGITVLRALANLFYHEFLIVELKIVHQDGTGKRERMQF